METLRMTGRSRRGADSEEIGWISLVDLLVVLCSVGFLAFVTVSSQSRLRRVAEVAKPQQEPATPKPSDSGAQQREKLDNDLKHARSQVEGLTREIGFLQTSLLAAQRKEKDSGRLRQELLGITGHIGNVVFVVDRSQSMNDGGLWDKAKRTIETWISLLPVDRAALVLFGSDIRVIPSSIRLSDALQPDSRTIPLIDEAGRGQMKKELNELQPDGGTPTYKALRRAMEFRDIDAIILFTDGNPDGFNGEGTAEQVHQLIAEWRSSHPRGRVHAVGIGDYFNVSMGSFLRGVAERGDGVFIGR